jgi:nitroreductase/dihydropteridine reductase
LIIVLSLILHPKIIKLIFMALLDSLKWRYATKRMTSEKVSEKDLNTILDATHLSASSAGLQPYTIVVVSNPEVKKQLQTAAYGQAQLVESSEVLVFCAWENITADQINGFVDNITVKRGLPQGSLEGLRAMVQGNVDNKTQQQQQEWSARQAYIALGTALATAAELHIDACPMEGFNNAQFDEILGLKEKGLKSVVILALGFRSPEDKFAGALKVRKDKNQLFQFVD